MHATTRRAGEVAAVLAHHGLGAAGDLLDLRVLLPRLHQPPPGQEHVWPPRVRRAFEDLGPTFIKLGQVLSTRPDLIPPAYEAELARLQDSAPRVPFADIVDAVESALGASITKRFASFDAQPLAAASIGQVHAATLPDGADVVVKVRRPGVVDHIETDLELLARFARGLHQFELLRRYDPVALAHEFAETLRGELDYVREGRNAELLAEGFADDARVHIPIVHWSHTADGVITEERIRGTKIDDVRALSRIGADRVTIARTFAEAYLSMVFVRGFFHADPHPGNVFVEASGRLGFVDFGMVGVIGDATKRGLGDILLSLVAGDASAMAGGLLHLGVASVDVERSRFERDLDRLLTAYATVPLEQLKLGPLLNDLMGVVRSHRLRLPSDLALLLKTVMMCEGVAAHLDPQFELVPLLVPYAQRLAG